jgi:hypothetical protein
MVAGRVQFYCQERKLDLRHATTVAFKRIKVGQVVKARCYPIEPHGLSAACAKRRLWRALIGAFALHGQSGP